MLQLPNNEAGPPPTTATYVDNSDCAGCHDDINLTWSATPHGSAFLVLNSTQRMSLSCAPCHVTGAGGHPSIYPATGYDVTAGTPAYLRNVTCQVCHGPGSDHVSSTFAQKKATIGLVMNSSLCGSCHSSGQGLSGKHHPTWNEWNASTHARTQLPSYISNVTNCANCHEAWNAMKHIETGTFRDVMREPGEDAPITWEIACVTCHDPHAVGYSNFELRVPVEDLCARCHNSEGAVPGQEPHHPMAEMRNNTAGAGTIDRVNTTWMQDVYCAQCHLGTHSNLAGTPNHTFAPQPIECWSCHNSSAPTSLQLFPTVQDAKDYITSKETAYNQKVAAVTPEVDAAKAILKQMAGNRTTQNLATWNTQYNIAVFNLHSVTSDASNGNHNPPLAMALMNDSSSRAEDIVSHLTPPAKITGVTVVTEGGKLKVTWTASTATDFAKYRIYVLDSSKTNVTAETANLEITDKATVEAVVSDLETGKTYYVYVTAVDADGNEITNTLTAESTKLPGSSSMLLYVLIGIVLIIVVAIAAIMMMRRKKGAAPSEIPPTPPSKT